MFVYVKFFDKKEKSFIAWIGSVIRPLNIQEDEYIFREGESIIEMFFMVSGESAYVLPRFDNFAYLNFTKG